MLRRLERIGTSMNILLGTVQPYIPQTAGGAQTSTHELARELAALGHTVSVLSGLNSSGWLGLRNRVLLKFAFSVAPQDRTLGYSVYRTWNPVDAVPHVLKRVRPDVVVLSTWQALPVAMAFEQAGIPVVIYLRDVEFGDLGGDLRTLKRTSYIANSRFTANSYKAAFGIDATIVPPLFQPSRYIVETSRQRVAFINPHPAKGVDIALAVAEACQEIPFTFVEGWSFLETDRLRLMRRIESLPNVRWQPRTQDMRTVYRDTRVMLVPSQWEEAWCRVVSEAQYSGIPVLGSNRGGLPESIGPGGVLLDANSPIQEWVAQLRRLWTDTSWYSALSAAAKTHSLREELDRATQVRTVLCVLQDAAGMRPGLDILPLAADGAAVW